jgi:hypothetical protein
MWDTTNATHPKLVDQNTGVELSTLPENPEFEVWVAYPQTVFNLQDGGTILDTKTATASCASGSTWNTVSKICEIPLDTGIQTITHNFGGIYSSCTATYSGLRLQDEKYPGFINKTVYATGENIFPTGDTTSLWNCGVSNPNVPSRLVWYTDNDINYYSAYGFEADHLGQALGNAGTIPGSSYSINFAIEFNGTYYAEIDSIPYTIVPVCGTTYPNCNAGNLSDGSGEVGLTWKCYVNGLASNYVGNWNGSWYNPSCSVSGSPADLTSPGLVTPTTATVNTNVTLSATILNQGGSSTGTGFTNLFQKATDINGTGATDIGTYQRTTALAVNDTATASLTYKFTSAGTYYVRVCADKSSSGSSGTITESNELNNCGGWTPVVVATNSPDLTASAITPTATTTGTTILKATISNNGGASTGIGFTNLFQSADAIDGLGATNLGTAASVAVAANGTSIVTFSKTFTAGTYYIRACADLNMAWVGTIAEPQPSPNGEFNNCGDWTPVVVSANLEDLPDLTTSAITPVTVTTNTNTVFSATVSNGGKKSTGTGFTNIFQVAADINGTNSMNFPDVQESTALSSLSSTEVSFTRSFSSSGTYYLRICADLNLEEVGTIIESNEDNNCGDWAPVVVTGPSNPLCSTDEWANPETCITVSLKADPEIIDNDGKQTSELTWVSTNAAYCTWEGTYFTPARTTAQGDDKAKPESTATSTRPTTKAGDIPLGITCSNSTGTATSTVSMVTVKVMEPTATITANPTRVKTGTPSTITWEGINVKTCQVSGPLGPPYLATGGADESNKFTKDSPQEIIINAQSAFTIDCTTKGDPSDPKTHVVSSVMVNIIPDFKEF